MSTTTQPSTGSQLQKPAQQRMSIRALFEQQRPELNKLLPKSMSLDRLYRLALSECTKNPDLLQCSVESWALAMQVCAAQGLYPDSGLGFMYLIPRNNSKKRNNEWVKVWEVTAQRGYQGDIQLARNSGDVADIYAEVVYERDRFVVKKGLERIIEHEPYLGPDDPGALCHAYAVAKLKSGETAWVHLTRRDVERHKASAQGTDSDKSPWKKHEAAMWKKTAIHELVKWLPRATENMELLARGDERDAGPPIEIAANALPAESRSALELVKDQLRGEVAQAPDAGGEDGPAPAPETCDHPEIPPSRLANLPSNQALVCNKCGEELPGEAPAEREPGSDDGDEALVREFVEKTTAPATPAGKPKQGRLDD